MDAIYHRTRLGDSLLHTLQSLCHAGTLAATEARKIIADFDEIMAAELRAPENFGSRKAQLTGRVIRYNFSHMPKNSGSAAWIGQGGPTWFIYLRGAAVTINGHRAELKGVAQMGIRHRIINREATTAAEGLGRGADRIKNSARSSNKSPQSICRSKANQPPATSQTKTPADPKQSIARHRGDDCLPLVTRVPPKGSRKRKLQARKPKRRSFWAEKKGKGQQRTQVSTAGARKDKWDGNGNAPGNASREFDDVMDELYSDTNELGEDTRQRKAKRTVTPTSTSHLSATSSSSSLVDSHESESESLSGYKEAHEANNVDDQTLEFETFLASINDVNAEAQAARHTAKAPRSSSVFKSQRAEHDTDGSNSTSSSSSSSSSNQGLDGGDDGELVGTSAIKRTSADVERGMPFAPGDPSSRMGHARRSLLLDDRPGSNSSFEEETAALLERKGDSGTSTRGLQDLVRATGAQPTADDPSSCSMSNGDSDEHSDPCAQLEAELDAVTDDQPKRRLVIDDQPPVALSKINSTKHVDVVAHRRQWFTRGDNAELHQSRKATNATGASTGGRPSDTRYERQKPLHEEHLELRPMDSPPRTVVGGDTSSDSSGESDHEEHLELRQMDSPPRTVVGGDTSSDSSGESDGSGRDSDNDVQNLEKFLDEL